MLHLIKLFVLAILFTSLNANYIDKSILKNAKETNKKIIIQATADDCYYCEKMKKEVISFAVVQKKINKNFILIEVNVEESVLPFKLNSIYGGITPTFFILDGKGNLEEQYQGSWSKEDFLYILDENK